MINGPSTTGNPSGGGRSNNVSSGGSGGGNLRLDEPPAYMVTAFPAGTKVKIKPDMWHSPDDPWKAPWSRRELSKRREPNYHRSMGGRNGVMGEFPFDTWEEIAGLTGTVVGHTPSYPYAKYLSLTCYVEMPSGHTVEFKDDELEIVNASR